jgi:hypothetical protein
MRFRHWILGALLMMATVSAQAESWASAVARIWQSGQSLLSQTGDTWGGELARQDLTLLLSALRTFEQWQQDEDRPLSRELLQDLRHQIGRYRGNLKLSLAATGDSSAQAWLSEEQALESKLQGIERSFAGHFLPTRHELLASSTERDWILPGYQDPTDLLREARSIRIDLQTNPNPGVVPGGGLPGFGPFGLGYAGDGWGNDFQELLRAADRFERACQLRYEDVRETERAYRQLDVAFQRVWPRVRSGSFGLRNVERSLERLERFYQATKVSRETI